MTKQEFISGHRDLFVGLVFDALTNSRHENLLGAWARETMIKITNEIGRMYDELQPKPPAQPAGEKK